MSRCFVPLLLAALAASAASQTSCVATGARSDCGYVGVDADNCKAKGCCWVPATGSNDQDNCQDKNTGDDTKMKKRSYQATYILQ